ncbi:MAG: trypsin-like peptidase domain-containing protein [Deltaproteobacteria bacterium]|nr:trypsin-like peptidase domain-containing protein [Deltaproteobacteria bacterium]
MICLALLNTVPASAHRFRRIAGNLEQQMAQMGLGEKQVKRGVLTPGADLTSRIFRFQSGWTMERQNMRIIYRDPSGKQQVQRVDPFTFRDHEIHQLHLLNKYSGYIDKTWEKRTERGPDLIIETHPLADVIDPETHAIVNGAEVRTTRRLLPNGKELGRTDVLIENKVVESAFFLHWENKSDKRRSADKPEVAKQYPLVIQTLDQTRYEALLKQYQAIDLRTLAGRADQPGHSPAHTRNEFLALSRRLHHPNGFRLSELIPPEGVRIEERFAHKVHYDAKAPADVLTHSWNLGDGEVFLRTSSYRINSETLLLETSTNAGPAGRRQATTRYAHAIAHYRDGTTRVTPLSEVAFLRQLKTTFNVNASARTLERFVEAHSAAIAPELPNQALHDKTRIRLWATTDPAIYHQEITPINGHPYKRLTIRAHQLDDGSYLVARQTELSTDTWTPPQLQLFYPRDGILQPQAISPFDFVRLYRQHGLPSHLPTLERLIQQHIAEKFPQLAARWLTADARLKTDSTDRLSTAGVYRLRLGTAADRQAKLTLYFASKETLIGQLWVARGDRRGTHYLTVDLKNQRVSTTAEARFVAAVNKVAGSRQRAITLNNERLIKSAKQLAELRDKQISFQSNVHHRMHPLHGIPAFEGLPELPGLLTKLINSGKAGRHSLSKLRHALQPAALAVGALFSSNASEIANDLRHTGATGTAALVMRDGNLGWVLTNYHTIYDEKDDAPLAQADNEPLKRRDVRFEDGTRAWVARFRNVVYRNPRLDVALVEVALPTDFPQQIAPLKLRASKVKAGAKLNVIGYPALRHLPYHFQSLAAVPKHFGLYLDAYSEQSPDNNPRWTAETSLAVKMIAQATEVNKGVVEERGGRRGKPSIRLYTATLPGSSGSPVLDQQGAIVALNWGGPKETETNNQQQVYGELPLDVASAIPINAIVADLEKNAPQLLKRLTLLP